MKKKSKYPQSPFIIKPCFRKVNFYKTQIEYNGNIFDINTKILEDDR